MLEASVQKPEKMDWYRRVVAKNEDGRKKNRFVFSVWALLGGFMFFLYRKAYLYAFIVFLFYGIFTSISSAIGTYILGATILFDDGGVVSFMGGVA